MFAYGIIYGIRDILLDKYIYFGQTTTSIKQRRYEEICEHSNTKLSKYIRKAGTDKLKWDLITECDTQDELNKIETEYITGCETFLECNTLLGSNTKPRIQKKYVLCTSEDLKFVIHGLAKFCRMLPHIKPKGLYECVNGKRRIYKGIKCRRFKQNDEWIPKFNYKYHKEYIK